jgi:CheY-like chemotaxis protein
MVSRSKVLFRALLRTGPNPLGRQDISGVWRFHQTIRRYFRRIQVGIGTGYTCAMSENFRIGRKPAGGSANALVVVIDDDALALDAIGGLLCNWGLRVVSAGSEPAALAQLAELDQRPDLLICDYHLSEETTGIEVIARLRQEFAIPAILISGDAAPGLVREVDGRGYQVLHKPVDPKALRALLKRLL